MINFINTVNKGIHLLPFLFSFFLFKMYLLYVLSLDILLIFLLLLATHLKTVI